MTKGFYDYFNENMKAVGLPAPRSLFGSLTTAIATIASMVKLVETYGTKTTLAECIRTSPGAVIGAGGGTVGIAAVASEGLLVLGAFSAAYYVGASIGSLAIATGRSLSGGLSIAACLNVATAHRIKTPSWLRIILSTNPALRRVGTGTIGRYPNTMI